MGRVLCAAVANSFTKNLYFKNWMVSRLVSQAEMMYSYCKSLIALVSDRVHYVKSKKQHCNKTL
jgi:hypothetical protein